MLRFESLQTTFAFLRKHLVVIFSLGLVAAVGRVTQLGGFGEVSSSAHIILEIIIESARVLLFLYVLGISSVSKGIIRIRDFIVDSAKRKRNVAEVKQKLRREWPFLLLNVGAFLVVAGGINYLIDLTVYKTCFFLSLQQEGILSQNSSEWTLLLFLKNLSVIPLTLIFDAVLILWVTNKLSTPDPVKNIRKTSTR